MKYQSLSFHATQAKSSFLLKLFFSAEEFAKEPQTLRTEAASQSGGIFFFWQSVSFARRQQGEDPAAGAGVVFWCYLGSVQTHNIFSASGAASGSISGNPHNSVSLLIQMSRHYSTCNKRSQTSQLKLSTASLTQGWLTLYWDVFMCVYIIIWKCQTV